MDRKIKKLILRENIIKTFVLIFGFLCFLSFNLQAPQERINALEDAFIQGGETSTEAFGETKAKILHIGHSDKNSKYARITYLKFKMPKNFESIKKINLLINIKVFKKDDFPDDTFALSVFLVNTDNWSESNVTWEDALELGPKIAHINLPQTKTDKSEEVKIELDVNEIKDNFSKKRGSVLSLALTSYESKMSAVVTSKDNSPKFGPYLVLE